MTQGEKIQMTDNIVVLILCVEHMKTVVKLAYLKVVLDWDMSWYCQWYVSVK